MQSFEEVTQLIERLETNQIADRDEALQEIEAARVFLSVVHNRLGRLKSALQSDPLALWRIRQNNLADNLFKKVKGI